MANTGSTDAYRISGTLLTECYSGCGNEYFVALIKRGRIRRIALINILHSQKHNPTWNLLLSAKFNCKLRQSTCEQAWLSLEEPAGVTAVIPSPSPCDLCRLLFNCPAPQWYRKLALMDF